MRVRTASRVMLYAHRVAYESLVGPPGRVCHVDPGARVREADPVTTPPSPCTWCVVDDPCPCPEFIAWEDLTAPTEPRPCPKCSEAEFLRLAGERFDQIAARLGMQARSLEKHLQRHHRADLIDTTWKAYV